MRQALVRNGPQHRPLLDVRRDEDGGDAHAVAVEVEAVGRERVGRDGDGRRHVVVASAVLVVGDDEQNLLPQRRAAQRVVNVRYQLVAESNVVRRVLVIGQSPEYGVWEVARLDEGVRRQQTACGIALERVPLKRVVVKVEVVCVEPETRERQRLREVVEVNSPPPVEATRLESVEDGVHEVWEVERLVVDVAVRRAGVDEEAIGPRLVGGRRVPPV